MCIEAQEIDLSKATLADVRRWRQVYEADGDVEASEVLRSLEGAIANEDLPERIEAEADLFELLVLRRGVGL